MTPRLAERITPSKLVPFTCKVCVPAAIPVSGTRPTKVPSAATVNSPRNVGSENNHTYTGVPARNPSPDTRAAPSVSSSMVSRPVASVVTSQPSAHSPRRRSTKSWPRMTRSVRSSITTSTSRGRPSSVTIELPGVRAGSAPVVTLAGIGARGTVTGGRGAIVVEGGMMGCVPGCVEGVWVVAVL